MEHNVANVGLKYIGLPSIMDSLGEYGMTLVQNLEWQCVVVVLARAHGCFKDLNWEPLKAESPIVFDVKGFLSPNICTDLFWYESR